MINLHKVYNDISASPWHLDSQTVHLYLHLLANADSSGVVTIGRRALSQQTGISERSVRTIIQRLADTRFLALPTRQTDPSDRPVRPTRQTSSVTICNYAKYAKSARKADPSNRPVKPTRQTDPSQTPKKKAPEDYSLGYKCRLVFEQYFRETYNEEYYYAPKEAKAMQRLIKKIAFSRNSKGLPTDDDSLAQALNLFLHAINKNWIADNFTVTNIDSQYNSIISELKNSHYANPRTNSYQAELLAKSQRLTDAAAVAFSFNEERAVAEAERARQRAEIARQFQSE